MTKTAQVGTAFGTAFVDTYHRLGYTWVTMIGQFTAVYMKRGKWYLGYVEEIPGVNTQGRTLTETKRNLKEALTLILEANRAIAHRAHRQRVLEEPITVAIG